MSTNQCLNCQWWHTGSRKIKEADGSIVISKGTCQIRAPQLVQWGSEGAIDYASRWPSTDGGDSCGEWRSRDDRAARLLGTKFLANSSDEAA